MIEQREAGRVAGGEHDRLAAVPSRRAGDPRTPRTPPARVRDGCPRDRTVRRGRWGLLRRTSDHRQDVVEIESPGKPEQTEELVGVTLDQHQDVAPDVVERVGRGSRDTAQEQGSSEAARSYVPGSHRSSSGGDGGRELRRHPCIGRLAATVRTGWGRFGPWLRPVPDRAPSLVLAAVVSVVLVSTSCSITVGGSDPTAASATSPGDAPGGSTPSAPPVDTDAGSAASGRLAVVGRDGGLTTSLPDGSDQVVLVEGASDVRATQPTWSPDGRRLAWVLLDLAQGGNGAIVVAGPRGEDPVTTPTPFVPYYLGLGSHRSPGGVPRFGWRPEGPGGTWGVDGRGHGTARSDRGWLAVLLLRLGARR